MNKLFCYTHDMKQKQEKLFSDQSSEQPEVSSESMARLETAEETKKRSRRPLFLILIIISLLLFVMVFWRISLNNPLQQTSDSPSKNEANNNVDTTNWQTYQNDAYSYSILYPSELMVFSNSAGAGETKATADARSLFLAQAQDAEPYLNRYLDFEVFQLKPTFGSSFTESQIEIGNFSGWKYQPLDDDIPFTTYILRLGEQFGFLQVLVSNDPGKTNLAMQILNSLSWSQTTTNNEVTTNSGTSFQQLLATSCFPLAEDNSNSSNISYSILPADVPVEFSDTVSKKYDITKGLLCEAGGIAFATAREDGSAFITAQTSNVSPIGTLYIGDSNSVNGGMRTPQLSVEAQEAGYYTPYSRSPHVVASPNNLKTIVSLLGTEPYCPRESTPLRLEFLTYRELGELKLLVSRVMEYPLDGERRDMFITFADTVSAPDDAGNPYIGQYEICNSAEFEKALFSRFFSSYATMAPEYKAVIDENIADIMGLSLNKE